MSGNFQSLISTPYNSTPALSGIPVTSVPPTNGQALVYNSSTNQFVYTTVGLTPVGFVDLTSAQTITGVKTISSNLILAPGATISQGVNSFTMPVSTGALVAIRANNTLVGMNSGLLLTTGIENVSLGNDALASATLAQYNTAIGQKTIRLNIDGFENTAVGYSSLQFVTGSYNTGLGSASLPNLTTGVYNTAVGITSMGGNLTGNNNTSIGGETLLGNTAGSNNVAVGFQCGKFLKGSNNIIIGTGAASAYTTTESNNIVIGTNMAAIAGQSNTTTIGTSASTQCYIAGISNSTVTGVPVVVDSAGKLGVAPSSLRYKENVVPVKQYDIDSLRVVNFNYKNSEIVEVGLIAEEVETSVPELVFYDKEGRPDAVKYMSLIPMLLDKCQALTKRIELLEQKS